VAIFYLFPRITKVIPSTLVALVIGTLTAVIIGADVPVIGDIPSGLPPLRIGTLFNVDAADYLIVLEFALILAMLGSIDSLLTSVIADNITKTKHDSNRELVGQGIGNMAAALIGGIPGAGATKGTVVNIKAGGKTRVSGILHGVLLLIVLLGAGQYASFIPLSVLAGILIPIGLAIVDYKGFRHLRQVPMADSVVMLVVLLVTLFGSLIQAVGVGIVLASVLYMKQSSDLAEARTSVNPISTVDGERLSESDANEQIVEEGVFVKYLYGPMFFGFTARFQELIKDLSGKLKVLILCMDRVPYIDQSGLYAIEDAVLDLEREGAIVVFTGVDEQPMDMMRRIDIIPDLIPEEHIFESFDAALTWVRAYMNGASKSVEKATSAEM
jgi:SulP family sulfate permease